MKNKFSLIGLTINIITFAMLSKQTFGDWFPLVDMLGVFYYSIIAIIIMVILWWLIHLSRKNNESKPLFLVNFILTIFNSLSLLYPFLLIVFLFMFGTGDSS